MGCISSREEDNDKCRTEFDLQLLEQLSQGGFVETILVVTKIYNYCYVKQRKQWILRKKNIIKSIDQLTKSEQLESRNYFHSFLDQHPESHILLRPLKQYKPALGSIKISTGLQKNDVFPNQVYVKLLDQKLSQLMNFGNNGKYTFFLQLQMYKLHSLKQFYKFQQILQIKISKIFKFASYEFFGLIKWLPSDKITDLQKFLNKYQWNIKFIDTSDANQQHNIYFNGHEIFHILENENRPDADIFIALDPFGKVIRAEVADFYTSKKQQDQQLQCDEFDDLSSQKSKSIKYEKKLLKELHLHYSSYITKDKQAQKSVSFQLTKYQLIQQQILQSLETISQIQYKDFKQLFQSYRLQQILMRYHPGEPFQFELIKQEYFNYSFETQKYISSDQVYHLPSIYPSASIEKQKILSEICRELKESIGLRWKDPDLNIYSIPHKYTFNKTDLMDFLMEFTQQFHLNLFLLKSRTIKWIEKSKTESNILKWEQQKKLCWTKDLQQCFAFFNTYELHNRSIIIKTLEDLKKVKQQQEQHQNQFRQIKTQNLCTNGMNLIRQYISKGINYQIQVGQKIVKFDENLLLEQNCILFVIFNNYEFHIHTILNKLQTLNLPDQYEIKFVTSQITTQSKNNKIKQKISYHMLGTEWNAMTGFQFQQDIVERYFQVHKDYQAFYVTSEGTLENIQTSEQFIETLDIQNFINKQNDLIQEDWFTKQYNMKKNTDNEWKQLKKECINLNDHLNEIHKETELPRDALKLTSKKCLVWDSHNYMFKQYCSDVEFEQNLNIKQYAVLNNYAPTIVKLIVK